MAQPLDDLRTAYEHLLHVLSCVPWPDAAESGDARYAVDTLSLAAGLKVHRGTVDAGKRSSTILICEYEEVRFTWYGRPNTELSREELLKAIIQMMRAFEHERRDHQQSLTFLTSMPLRRKEM